MSTNSGMSKCPRCGTRSLEKLSTHDHCIECFYTQDHYFDVETAYHQVRRFEQTFGKPVAITLRKKTKKPNREAS